MEGALPSVVAGMICTPVIAVPTSVGYGASFGGIAALLGMLNSCANGVSVVNIDNGFGAGCIRSLINHVDCPPKRADLASADRPLASGGRDDSLWSRAQNSRFWLSLRAFAPSRL